MMMTLHKEVTVVHTLSALLQLLLLQHSGVVVRSRHTHLLPEGAAFFGVEIYSTAAISETPTDPFLRTQRSMSLPSISKGCVQEWYTSAYKMESRSLVLQDIVLAFTSIAFCHLPCRSSTSHSLASSSSRWYGGLADISSQMMWDRVIYIAIAEKKISHFHNFLFYFSGKRIKSHQHMHKSLFAPAISKINETIWAVVLERFINTS